MPSGIRVTVRFPSPAACVAAELTSATDAVVESASTSVSTETATESATDVLVGATDPPEADGLDRIFSYGSKHLYRRRHAGAGDPCPCERLGAFGCPVERYFAQDGELTLVFHAADFEALQAVVADLRGRFPDVDIRRLVRSPTEGAPGDNVFVDRSKLTGRQLEVLQTAYEMGYFARPREANATEVAAELGIGASTLTEHLNAAHSKLLGDILEDGT